MVGHPVFYPKPIGEDNKVDLLPEARRLRHEAELDSGLHADVEQEIENWVDVKERVLQLTIAHSGQRLHVTREQTRKADAAKARVTVRILQYGR